MGWPQYCMIAYTAIGCVGAVMLDGEPREPNNAGHTFLGVFVVQILLVAGGFYK